MFLMHISMFFAYSILLASTALIIWSLRYGGAGSAFGKIIGSFVFLLTLLSMLCISYYAKKYWIQGYFETPASMSMEMRQDRMEKMMPQMGEHMGQMGNMEMHTGKKPSQGPQ